jgi:hypothetical protein
MGKPSKKAFVNYFYLVNFVISFKIWFYYFYYMKQAFELTIGVILVIKYLYRLSYKNMTENKLSPFHLAIPVNDL